MAFNFSVILDPSIVSINPGEEVKFTAGFSWDDGIPEDYDVKSYQWFLDGIKQTVDPYQNYFTYKNATSGTHDITCTVFVQGTANGESFSETRSAESSVDVSGNGFSAFADINWTSTDPVPNEENAVYSASTCVIYANVIGDTPGGTSISYLWSTGETTKDITVKASGSSSKSFYCDITFTNDGYAAKTSRTPVLTLAIKLKPMPDLGYKIIIGPVDSTTVKLGQKFYLKCVPDKTVSGSYTFRWNDDNKGTTDTIYVTADKVGDRVYTCNVNVWSPEYESRSFRVESPVITTLDLPYIANTIVPGENTEYTDYYPDLDIPIIAVPPLQDYTLVHKFTGTLPADSSITYLWSTGETTQSITKSNNRVNSDGILYKCTATVTAPAYSEPLIFESKIKVRITTGSFEVTSTNVKVVPGTSLKYNDSYTATAEFTIKGDIRDEIKVTYLWTTGEKTQSITGVADKIGTITNRCRIYITHPAFMSKTVFAEMPIITVEKADYYCDHCHLSYTLEKNDEEKVTSYTVECTPPVIPDDSTVQYNWNESKAVEGDSYSQLVDDDFVGEIKVGVQVIANNPNYNVIIPPRSIRFYINNLGNLIPAECPLVYVHPLPWRSSAYIWCGWWVMDAIQSLTLEGKDWKTATINDTPYYCHLAVLNQMLVNYPEVDVQESRNGRIIHRSALDYGIIYN